MSGLFVTGTDTGVGKTRVAVELMRGLRAGGLRVAGMKPVATGAIRIEGRLRNDDALQLLAASSQPLSYEQVNPYVYEPPVSPHIAASMNGRPIEGEVLVQGLREAEALADVVIVEGVGGWETPLGDDFKVSDLAVELGLPVVLVVGLRLGCLNHAILSYEAIVGAGLECAAWVANQLDPAFGFVDDNIDTLRSLLPCPYWGCLPFVADSGSISANAGKPFPGNALDIDEILRRFRG